MGAREVQEAQVAETCWSQGRHPEERKLELRWAVRDSPSREKGNGTFPLDKKILCEGPKVCRKEDMSEALPAG